MTRVAGLAAALTAVLLLGGAPGAGATPHVRATAPSSAGDSTWSAARMAAARPLELVRDGSGQQLRLGRSRPVPFASFQEPNPTVYPNSTNGRLFGSINGLGDYSCSATVLDTRNGRLILTAGHCVFDPRLGRFAKDLTFVPAYADAQAPFGVWTWSSLLTTREWVRSGNSNFDYATVKLAKINATPIEAVVGGRVLKTTIKRNQFYGAFGYPANLAGGERMWTCLSEYAGKDPQAFRRGPAASAMGCDMTAGASGGGWVTADQKIVSVSSFGYLQEPNILYGPYLTRLARNIVRRAGR